MKIPAHIVVILAVIASIFVVWYANHKDKPEPYQPQQNRTYDSLISEMAKKDVIIALYQDSISKQDTVVIKQTVRIYVKAKEVFSLSADSSVKLFNSWTGKLSNDSIRERFFGQLQLGTD